MKISSILLFSLLASFALYADYDESVDGDISGDELSPTVIALVNGSNVVSLSSVDSDKDYFTITVPVGATLDALNLTEFTSANVGFISFVEGSTFSSNPGITDFLGWDHLELPLEDKLPVLAASTSTGAMGFDIPLPAGTYTFWSQETGSTPTSYTIDFVLSDAAVSAVPTLSEWSVIVLSLLMAIFALIGVRSRSLNVT